MAGLSVSTRPEARRVSQAGGDPGRVEVDSRRIVMQLTWYGHAAFQLSGQSGEGDNATVRVVLDPYRAPDVGTYAPIDDEAEIVAISHENEKYHSWIAAVRGPNGAPPIVVDGLALLDQPQPRIIGGLPFTATRVWENTDRREPIAMIGIEMEGIRFLHMGDCGHALTSEEVAACGRVDVLLALAGAGPTIALPDLANFIPEATDRDPHALRE